MGRGRAGRGGGGAEPSAPRCLAGTTLASAGLRASARLARAGRRSAPAPAVRPPPAAPRPVASAALGALADQVRARSAPGGGGYCFSSSVSRHLLPHHLSSLLSAHPLAI